MSGFVEALEIKFIGGVFLRKMSLAAGHFSITHAHAMDHGTIVAHGTGHLWTERKLEPYKAGDILTIKAGVNHRFEAETDTIVVCALLEDL